MLKHKGHSLVLRLWVDGGFVIAKRTKSVKVTLEQRIYERILQTLPVSTLHCYGSVEDENPGRRWLFLEDAGDETCSFRIPEHRDLASRYLADMHISASNPEFKPLLPDCGPLRYFAHLQDARVSVRNARANTALRSNDIGLLDQVLQQLDIVESRWTEIAALSDPFPGTLAHGDFVKKNLRIRAQQVLFPLDWETAGWANPATDLCSGVDLWIYWSVARQAWRGISFQDLERLVEQGKIFNLLAAIDWASRSLPFQWVERPMANMRLYQTQLAECLVRAGWESRAGLRRD